MDETAELAVSTCAARHHIGVIDTSGTVYGVGGINHDQSVRFDTRALHAQCFGVAFQIRDRLPD
jgi:hypothetical protein